MPERDEKRIVQHMGKCVHFTGISNNCCDAGVRYSEVTLVHEPIEYQRHGRVYSRTRSLPCVDDLNHAGATCAQRCTPTREEAEAAVRESNREIEHMMTARARITEREDLRGTVECPKCGGVLRYVRAGSNGHVHASCTTTMGCLSWME